MVFVEYFAKNSVKLKINCELRIVTCKFLLLLQYVFRETITDIDVQ